MTVSVSITWPWELITLVFNGISFEGVEEDWPCPWLPSPKYPLPLSSIPPALWEYELSFIGFNAAVISDCSSNSLRVIKTVKQTSKKKVSYLEVIKNIINKDGVIDLFGRGLKTRIITNGIQGILFTVCWKYIEESWNN